MMHGVRFFGKKSKKSSVYGKIWRRIDDSVALHGSKWGGKSYFH